MNARSHKALATLGWVWFPLALLALLILALPGIILLTLYALNLDGPVNGWLRQHLGITYDVAIPSEHWWAILLLLLTPFLLVLLYFLKLKRKPLHVPSTFLWKKSIEDLHVNSLFQWLRENVLLLLQLLVLLFLIYAVIDLHFHGRVQIGNHYIVLLDNSASMSATDVTPNRLRQAKDEALKEIDSRRDNDVGMVIVFNSSAEILQSYTNDRNLLRRAVESVAPTQRTTRIEEALSLANSLANPHRAGSEDPERLPGGPVEGVPTEVHVFSDGRFPDVPEFALDNLSLVLHTIGQPGPDAVDNVGIVSFNAVRDETDPTRLRVFVRVLNFRKKSVEVRLRLTGEVNGAKLEDPQSEVLALPGREAMAFLAGKDKQGPVDTPGESAVSFVVAGVDEASNVILHAELVDWRDQFALDDQAWLTVGFVRKARVLLAGPHNPILRAFFDHPATQRIVATTYLTPDELGDKAKYLQPAREGAFDLVIFDRCAPAAEDQMPNANTYFIDAVPPPWKRDDLPRLQGPQIKGWMGRHPLLRYLSGLTEIGVVEAFRFDLKDPRVPPRTPRLLEAGKDVALLFTLGRQSYTDLVMAFALINDKGEWTTNWPLQPRFPLFLRNVLYVLGNVSDSSGEDNVQPGDVKALRPDAAVKEIEVTDPAGKSERLQRGTRPDFTYGRTDQVGVYPVKWSAEDDGKEVFRVRRNFAVNLLDPAESNLEPRSRVFIGANEEGVSSEESQNRPRATWKYAAVIALLLLLLEWYIYNRRVYI